MSDAELMAMVAEIRASIGNVRDFVSPKAHRLLIRICWAQASAIMVLLGAIWWAVPLLSDFRQHVREEAERWEGTRDSIGKPLRPGQSEFNRDLATNQADVSANQAELVRVWQKFLALNPTLRFPEDTVEEPPIYRLNSPDGSR